ncbi:hypothetical protein [Pseudoduganella lutea]|uniref:hypothetical protein n=1 Tax=Pseudoduganella lutea TaxID=321985 RepID=UPI001E374D01|nr:hypothetical protein [Pseudoduganella lutea]
MTDFMVVDQRQPGYAKEQHEDGADKAAPLMDPGPAANGDRCHGNTNNTAKEDWNDNANRSHLP